MSALIQLSDEHVAISEPVLIYATNEEIQQLRNICDRIIERKRSAEHII